MFLKLILIASFCILSVVSRPNGAPLTACETMLPIHPGNQEQTSVLPVTLEVDEPIISGQPTYIRIFGTELLQSFGGFQIQARTQTNELIGTFQENDLVGLTACRNISGSSATHRNTTQKTAVKIIWDAPVVTELLTFNFQ